MRYHTTHRRTNIRPVRRTSERRARSFQFHKLILILFITLCISFLCGITFGSILSNATTTDEKAKDTFKYYKSITVEHGDSLWSIAKENISAEYVSVDAYIDEVRFINSLSGTTIHAGNSLTIPYYSTEFK